MNCCEGIPASLRDTRPSRLSRHRDGDLRWQEELSAVPFAAWEGIRELARSGSNYESWSSFSTRCGVFSEQDLARALTLIHDIVATALGQFEHGKGPANRHSQLWRLCGHPPRQKRSLWARCVDEMGAYMLQAPLVASSGCT